jgi:hypothetical protein
MEPTYRDIVLTERHQAWAALETDFRAQVAAGVLVLRGLMVAPNLANARSQVPAIWSSLLRLNVAQNMATAGDKKFIGVTVSRPAKLDVVVAAYPAEVPKITDDLPAPSKRRRGNAPATPLIEACLRANWEDVCRHAAKGRTGVPNWSSLARSVLKWSNKEQRDRHTKLPAFATIRGHLPELYAELLREKTVR